MAARVIFYQELIEKELAEIKAEYESAVGALTNAEYLALIEPYQAMLDINDEGFLNMKKLTKLDHKMMFKRMSKPLLVQNKKPDTNKILILSLQMKQEFANVKHDFLIASNKIFKDLKTHND